MTIYQAVSFDKPIRAGGSTYPWVIRVLTEGGRLVPYVVKLFTDRQIEQQHAVAKEVFANRLAREFDLPVPDCALIEFTPAFISSLPLEQAERLANIHNGLKFGSALAQDMAIVKPDLLPSFLKEYDLGIIFAFDNLIQNLDRGGHRDKPNLLINDNDFLLIDHEQAFPFANNANTSNALTWSFDPAVWTSSYRACYKHLFYPNLKNLRREAKNGLFSTFQEYLRYADITVITKTADELQRAGVSVGRVDLITDYLSQTKTQHTEFTHLLQSLIA